MTRLATRFRLRELRSQVQGGPILIVALGGCALSMLAATLSIRLHATGFSARAIGLNAAAAGVAALAVAPLVPAMAARFGTVRLLGSALVTAAASLAGFALTASFAAWLVLRAVEGGCATVLFVLGEYWITARVSDGWRGVVIGLYVVGVGASFALGPLLLALVDPLSPGPILAGIGLFAAGACILRAVAAGAPAIPAQRRAPMLLCYAAAPALMMAAVLHGAIETAGLNLLPVYAVSQGGTPARGALDAGLFIIGAGVLQFPIGVAAGRFGRSRMLRLLAAVATVGATMLAAIGTASPVTFAIGLVLWGGIVGSFYPVGLGELPRRFGGDRLVGANAAFVLAYAVGTLIGPPLAGEAIDRLPGGGFFLLLAALNGVYLAVALSVSVGRA